MLNSTDFWVASAVTSWSSAWHINRILVTVLLISSFCLLWPVTWSGSTETPSVIWSESDSHTSYLFLSVQPLTLGWCLAFMPVPYHHRTTTFKYYRRHLLAALGLFFVQTSWAIAKGRNVERGLVKRSSRSHVCQWGIPSRKTYNLCFQTCTRHPISCLS